LFAGIALATIDTDKGGFEGLAVGAIIILGVFIGGIAGAITGGILGARRTRRINRAS
jgi:outer membrane lipoprotein SlyB